MNNGLHVNKIKHNMCAIYSIIETKLFIKAYLSSLPVVEDKPTHKPRGRLGPHVLPDDQDNVRVTCCGVQEEKKSKE